MNGLLQLPPDFTEELGASLGTSAVPYVSIKGNRFTLVDTSGDTEPVTTVDPKTGVSYLDCVIIDANRVPSKIFYLKAYESDSHAPPDCWSDNGVAPSANCGSPQAPSCSADPTGVNGCKHAVWGSATSKISGKGIPACGTYRKLALLIPGDDIQFCLRVPPNSLSNLQDYTTKFKGQNFGMRDVVTRISFEADTLGTLTFTGVARIDEATTKQRNAILLGKATDTLVGRGDVPRLTVQGVTMAPAPPLPTPAPTASLPASAPAAGAAPAATAPAAPSRRRRKSAEAAPVTEVLPAEPAKAPFGMGTPPAPNAEIEAGIKSIFG